VPLYPLYALLFADAGMSASQISALFIIWSVVAVVAEVPSGALADRYSRRAALVAAGVLQALAYASWITIPTFAGFAAGFVLWAVGGSLTSGAFQALLHDGLAHAGEGRRYGAVLGRAEAAALAIQVPVAGAASVLAAAGGFTLAGWVSVGTCLGAAALAATLPDHRVADDDGEGERGYLATLVCGVREAAGAAAVRGAVVAVAVLTAFEGLEEYSPLLAAGWGVPVGAIPLALLAVPLAGAAGSALAGRVTGARTGTLTFALGVAAFALGVAAVLGRPAGIAGFALFYGLWRLVLVVADVRLQQRITGPSRATVTSVAGLASELSVVLLFGAWAVGGIAVATVLALVTALTVPRLLRRTRPAARAAFSRRRAPAPPPG
jgi:predicted MFS family arabinose efflux permease